MFRFLAELFGLLRDIFKRVFRVRTPAERLAKRIQRKESYHIWLRKELDAAYAERNGAQVAALRNELRIIAGDLLMLQRQATGGAKRQRKGALPG